MAFEGFNYSEIGIVSGAFGILIAVAGVIVMNYGFEGLRDEAVQPAPTVNVEPLEPKVVTRMATYETTGGFSSSQLAASLILGSIVGAVVILVVTFIH